jgi:antitoxin ParD1/3/4
MGKIEKLSVALTPEQARALKVAVEMGDFATTSEAVRRAVDEWIDRRDKRTAAAIRRIRELWDEGVASGPAREPRTAEQIKAEGRRRLAALKARG